MHLDMSRCRRRGAYMSTPDKAVPVTLGHPLILRYTRSLNDCLGVSVKGGSSSSQLGDLFRGVERLGSSAVRGSIAELP